VVRSYPHSCYRKLDPSRNENFYVNKHGMRTAAYAPTLLEPEAYFRDATVLPEPRGGYGGVSEIRACVMCVSRANACSPSTRYRLPSVMKTMA
jgi:hypothetical protein